MKRARRSPSAQNPGTQASSPCDRYDALPVLRVRLCRKMIRNLARVPSDFALLEPNETKEQIMASIWRIRRAVFAIAETGAATAAARGTATAARRTSRAL